MRTSILVMLLLIMQSWTALNAAAFMNEPVGFNDMRWGAPVGTQFTKDDFIGISTDEKSSRYLRISDSAPLDFDNVKLHSMVYSFYNGKLWKVELEARLLQAGKLLDAFTARYGEPSYSTNISEFSREYTWSGVAAEIVLVTSLNFYDRKTADIATATIYSKKIKSVILADTGNVLTDRKYPIDSIDGFRGRKWGSGFKKGVTYLPLEQEPYFVYVIKDEDKIFEGVNVEEIRYRFYNNKSLQKVELYFSGKQNYLKLKEACFKLFGQTSQYEQGEIRWIGKKTTASLSFTIDPAGIWHSRLNYFGFGTQ